MLTLKQGFYTTYKELKQAIRHGYCYRCKSFYTTYKELKPNKRIRQNRHNCKGFYTTYKELKLQI